MTQALQYTSETMEIYRGHQHQDVRLLPPVNPEDEVYGRSLSAVRRLGVAIYENPDVDLRSCPEANQAKIEFYTSVEEGLGTDKEFGKKMEVNKTVALKVEGGSVLSYDNKTPVSQMTENGLICAGKEAKRDPRFQAQYVRSSFDHPNALDVDAMARGERAYNTKIVVTPYPEEAAEKTGHTFWDKRGYVSSLRRGFVQMYHVNEEGKEIVIDLGEGQNEISLDDGGLLTGSYSFEGSNKEYLREVFKKLGIAVPEDTSTDEWLQFAIKDNLTAEQAVQLAKEIAKMCNQNIDKTNMEKAIDTVEISTKYAPLLDKIFYENYTTFAVPTVTGLQTEDLKNVIASYVARSQYFNRDYQYALSKMMSRDSFDDDDAAVVHELLVYSAIEMVRGIEVDRTPETQQIMHNLSPAQLATLGSRLFQDVLGSFSRHGAKSNRSYEACGNGISLGGEGSEFDQQGDVSPQEAFGGLFGGRTDKFGSLKFRCQRGHENERKENEWVMECKVCGIDVSCGKKAENAKKKLSFSDELTKLVTEALKTKKPDTH